ncbi:Histone-lysine N-methyltransferase SETMAR [Eumeta japonica]|uniref:Histone-lysine N-methyltransferase SETMAR n=1 Tax=Eumeta variegata TaxID=151549 RepID=A0A4C1YHL4_EUMVA|nr:Histone-lysine N-methyltransferase SETMAR [Eumeta japonica]
MKFTVSLLAYPTKNGIDSLKLNQLLSIEVAQNWFKRFQSGNFNFKDEIRSGRLVTDEVDAILEKVEQDQHTRSYDIAEELGIDHTTVLTRLKKARFLGPTRAH